MSHDEHLDAIRAEAARDALLDYRNTRHGRDQHNPGWCLCGRPGAADGGPCPEWTALAQAANKAVTR